MTDTEIFGCVFGRVELVSNRVIRPMFDDDFRVTNGR